MQVQSIPHLYDTVIPVTWFIALGLAFSFGEWIAPLRWRSSRAGRVVDTIGLSVAWVVSAVVIDMVGRMLGIFAGDPLGANRLPLGARAVIYVVASDACRYGAHRLMHTQLFWPTHSFHHSATFLDWFGGNRASVPHVLMFMAPMAVIARSLQITPGGVLLNVCIMLFWNDFMHANIRLSSTVQRYCEWLITTPRYHHIHHSVDVRHRDVNLGSVLTIWDRLFGTYVNPDCVDGQSLKFGAERSRLWRWLAGV
jgi:sterol desaturase/sphingolipid hydroxylase (fatty acid hydroxylase superfamily)